MKFIFIYVTCPKTTLAKKIARNLIQKKKVACANILPGMKSIYRWAGKIQEDKEVVLILKTRASLFKVVESEIRKIHPYECPCIVALPLPRGSKTYFRWIETSTALRL